LVVDFRGDPVNDAPIVKAAAGDIELEYEELGSGEPLVLIMGIGAQMIYWPDELVEGLAERGFRVIRFDNRDVGLSTKLDGQRVGDMREALARYAFGLPIEAPYTLSDMARDVTGLLDALGLESAHVVGASMGGMIAQTFAIEHPERLRSLTSIMSHTGDRRFMLAARPRAARVLLAKAPRSREEAMDRAEAFYRVVGGRGFPLDVAGVRDRSGRAYDRCFYPQGFLRQFFAILASGSRSSALRGVTAPTLVLHGSDDPLILPWGGRATAQAVPGATFHLVRGMGHDLPRGAWPQMINGIANTAAVA
jgi:pimeloyl-ACP methyl ester carboxylesterase